MHVFRTYRTGFTSLTALSSADQDLPALIERVLQLLRVTLEPDVTVPAAQRILLGGTFQKFIESVFETWKKQVRHGWPLRTGPHEVLSTQLAYLELLDERDRAWVVTWEAGGRLATTVLTLERVAVVAVRLHYTCNDVRARYATLPAVWSNGLKSFVPMHEMPRFLAALPTELRESLYDDFACSSTWLVACDWMDEYGGKLIANFTATLRRLFRQVHEMNQQEKQLKEKHNVPCVE